MLVTLSYLPANICVLVVDDMPSRRAVVNDLLHAIGTHNIKQAASLPEALHELGAASVDAILLACRDPGRAPEFASRIRASGNHAYVPILLIVDSVDGPTASSSRDAGVTDFIARPVTEAAICR